MSNHNYSQYSNKKNKKSYNKPDINDENFVTTVEAPVESAEIKMVVEPEAVVEPIIVNETVDTVVLPKTIIGTVTNCSKLNVRSKPATDAEVVTVLNSDSEVIIDPARSTNEWLKITTTAGVEGYCMRKFVNAKL